MKYSYFDPKTNENYNCENEYEFKIKSFTAKHDYNFWDDEVIKYAIEIKNEIISGLEKNSSESDKIRLEHEDLPKRIADFKDILSTKSRVFEIIKNELSNLRGKYFQERFYWV